MVYALHLKKNKLKHTLEKAIHLLPASVDAVVAAYAATNASSFTPLDVALPPGPVDPIELLSMPCKMVEPEEFLKRRSRLWFF